MQRDRAEDLKALTALKHQVASFGQKIQPQVNDASKGSSTSYASSSSSPSQSQTQASASSFSSTHSLSSNSCAACDADYMYPNYMHPVNSRLAGTHTYTYPCKEVSSSSSSSSSRSTSTTTSGCPYAQLDGLHDTIRSTLKCTCGKCCETPATSLPLQRTTREQCPRANCFHDMFRSSYTCTCGQC